MRKRITSPESNRTPESPATEARTWHDLTRLATVEVSSEDPLHPIESALTPGIHSGWRASAGGRQIIRLLFDEPLTVRAVHLEFAELELPRTQEFALKWQDALGTEREIVRQQFNFSPGGSTHEIEDYRVSLVNAVAIELQIMPDINGGPAPASLQQFLLA
jgi:hypothetical protein